MVFSYVQMECEMLAIPSAHFPGSSLWKIRSLSMHYKRGSPRFCHNMFLYSVHMATIILPIAFCYFKHMFPKTFSEMESSQDHLLFINCYFIYSFCLPLLPTTRHLFRTEVGKKREKGNCL